MKCARCHEDIEDGKQTVLWHLPYVSFLCPACTAILDAEGAVKDITEEVMGQQP